MIKERKRHVVPQTNNRKRKRFKDNHKKERNLKACHFIPLERQKKNKNKNKNKNKKKKKKLDRKLFNFHDFFFFFLRHETSFNTNACVQRAWSYYIFIFILFLFLFLLRHGLTSLIISLQSCTNKKRILRKFTVELQVVL